MKQRSKTARNVPGTQAIRRGLSLLDVFTDERPQWGLTEIAGEVGLNKTTTYRLLSVLEAERLIARDPESGAYRLGPALIVLGARAIRSTGLRAVTRPELELLAHETGESATLEVPLQDDVLILDEVQGRYLLGTAPAIGTRWPLHATSTGKALLAFGGAQIPRRLGKFTPLTITSPRKLTAELARIRERGFAVNNEELELAYVGVGAPVRDHRGEVVAAISLGAPKSRMTADRIREIGELVAAAAARASRALGAVGGTAASLKANAAA